MVVVVVAEGIAVLVEMASSLAGGIVAFVIVADVSTAASNVCSPISRAGSARLYEQAKRDSRQESEGVESGKVVVMMTSGEVVSGWIRNVYLWRQNEIVGTRSLDLGVLRWV